jgi:hypothetical protein
VVVENFSKYQPTLLHDLVVELDLSKLVIDRFVIFFLVLGYWALGDVVFALHLLVLNGIDLNNS